MPMAYGINTMRCGVLVPLCVYVLLSMSLCRNKEYTYKQYQYPLNSSGEEFREPVEKKTYRISGYNDDRQNRNGTTVEEFGIF